MLKLGYKASAEQFGPRELLDFSVLAEESGRSGENEFVWIIDPLDGTTNFLHGFPTFAVSIALEQKGRLQHAVRPPPVRETRGDRHADPEGQRRVYRRLQFLPIYSEHCESGLAALHEPACVNRPEGFLQIHRRAELHDRQIRKGFAQHSFQHALVRHASCAFRGTGPGIALAANLQLRRTRLSHSLNSHPKRLTFGFDIQHAAN